ncbi:uncharacterized protein CLUP02_08755 [Colletotrichum lupini]|uniref:Uncharacterized protein n=1 Tax=Colletotrichum lupini TaxID=145971 RepID=A0A9Q8SUW2_9PEZI|nr:uncharacterized protein CLUP02_08755 [Colletotrichum lupini]UQC83261.1 hypothetical protein CLUP02_08755 [Colletotrichum lupini]
MFPDPSDSISKKKNYPIDAIVVCQAVAMILELDSVFGFSAVRHRRRRPLLRTHAHYTPQPLSRSIDGLGMTARFGAFMNAIESVSALTHGINTAVCAALISRTTYSEALVFAYPTPLPSSLQRAKIKRDEFWAPCFDKLQDLEDGLLFVNITPTSS